MIRSAVSIPSFSSKKGHIEEDVGDGRTAGTVNHHQQTSSLRSLSEPKSLLQSWSLFVTFSIHVLRAFPRAFPVTFDVSLSLGIKNAPFDTHSLVTLSQYGTREMTDEI